MTGPLVYITRCESFAACRRLHNPALSDEENRKIFGPCNNPNGYGHNYTVEVTVKNSVDPATGMALNFTDLKMHVRKVVDQLDHKNFDKDVAGLKGLVSTTENVAIFIWNELMDQIPRNCGQLYEVVVHETEKNKVTYKGE